jgi:hypothetical protein
MCRSFRAAAIYRRDTAPLARMSVIITPRPATRFLALVERRAALASLALLRHEENLALVASERRPVAFAVARATAGAGEGSSVSRAFFLCDPAHTAEVNATFLRPPLKPSTLFAVSVESRPGTWGRVGWRR